MVTDIPAKPKNKPYLVVLGFGIIATLILIPIILHVTAYKTRTIDYSAYTTKGDFAAMIDRANGKTPPAHYDGFDIYFLDKIEESSCQYLGQEQPQNFDLLLRDPNFETAVAASILNGCPTYQERAVEYGLPEAAYDRLPLIK